MCPRARLYRCSSPTKIKLSESANQKPACGSTGLFDSLKKAGFRKLLQAVGCFVGREMNNAITMPRLWTLKDKTVGEIAVLILRREWPLPLKSLQWKVGKEHGKEVSFQATHKAFNKLVEQSILVKEGKLYRLNVEWLEQLIDFGIKTRQAYLDREKFFGGFWGAGRQWR